MRELINEELEEEPEATGTPGRPVAEGDSSERLEKDMNSPLRVNRWKKATTKPVPEVEPIPGEDATEGAGEAAMVKTLIEISLDSLN